MAYCPGIRDVDDVLGHFLADLKRDGRYADTGSEAPCLGQLLSLANNRPVFSEMYFKPAADYCEACLTAEDRRKMILSTKPAKNDEWRLKGASTQLFDLSADPENKRNLFSEKDPAHLEPRDVRSADRSQEERG